MDTCDICGGKLASQHRVREMMLGTREEFTYGECGACRSLQLLDVPDDLGAYYPSEYYSFSPGDRDGLLERVVKRVRAEALARGQVAPATWLSRGAPLPSWPGWLRAAGKDRSCAICDLGSGTGALLVELKTQGFRDLTGADAFIPETMERSGIRIYKATPQELPGTYDFIMLNHSFEHMPDPLGTLEALKKRLRPGGVLMVRVPVADSPLWERYGVHWSSIDAPRHLYIPSLRGMAAAAERASLQQLDVLHESSAAQIWRSEQYRNGITLFDPRAHDVDPLSSGFTREQLREWHELADRMNRERRGAAAAFFLRPV